MRLFQWFKKEPKPFDTGLLDVGNGHEIYYQQFGNPTGVPVLTFHGGPGGSARVKLTNSFDLKKYRVLLFDQRGCGRSVAKNPVKDNTPAFSVQDAADLLDHLKIKGKIVICGGSFGATLALLFAETYPERTGVLLLNSVFLGRKKDIEWVDKDSGYFYPDMMDTLRQKAGSNDTITAYHKMIFSEKYKDLQRVLTYFGEYEHMLGKLNPAFPDKPVPVTDGGIAWAQIALTYEKNKMFLKENQILNNIARIKNKPCLICHNRLDMVCPVEQAWLVHRAMTRSKLIIVPSEGHSSPQLHAVRKKEIAVFLEKHGY